MALANATERYRRALRHAAPAVPPSPGDPCPHPAAPHPAGRHLDTARSGTAGHHSPGPCRRRQPGHHHRHRRRHRHLLRHRRCHLPPHQQGTRALQKALRRRDHQCFGLQHPGAQGRQAHPGPGAVRRAVRRPQGPGSVPQGRSRRQAACRALPLSRTAHPRCPPGHRSPRHRGLPPAPLQHWQPRLGHPQCHGHADGGLPPQEQPLLERLRTQGR